MAIDHAKLADMRFEGELEELLKRHEPLEYAQRASNMVRAWFDGKVNRGQWRPHDLLHSIEANCAYHRKQRRVPVTVNTLAAILNVYYRHADEYIKHLFGETKVMLAFRVMHSQQIPIQYRPNLYDLARCYLLFVAGDPLPKTTKWLKATHKLTPYEWFALAYGAMSMTLAGQFPTATAKALKDFEAWAISAESVDSFFQLSSRTPTEVGEQYRGERAAIEKPYLRRLIPSGFLNKPFLQFDAVYFSPHPALVCRYAAGGIYELCRECPDFGDELGRTFERYVHSVLDLLPCDQLVGATEMEEATPGRSCDFLLEFSDSIVLVECKATRFSRRFLTDDAIRGDNSTSKIVEATDQLRNTADAIRQHRLPIVSDPEKPIDALIVSYDEIPLANSPWYRSDIIRPLLREKLGSDDDWPKPFAQWPQVLDTRTLEMMVCACCEMGDSVASIIAKKEGQAFVVAGDWNPYLPNLLPGGLPPLPMAEKAIDDFLESVIGHAALDGTWAEPTS